MIKFVDKHIRGLILTSIVLLFAEFSFGEDNSLSSSMMLFLWVERIIASIFTVEYFIRLYHNRSTYACSYMGVIDLFSFLPFIAGFFVPPSWLGWVRCMRIVRILKMFRYDRHLQLFALAVYRSLWLLKAIGKIAVFAVLLGSALMYQAERYAQPEFDNIWNVMYFVVTTTTTIGYGDMSPVTPLGKIIDIFFVYLPGVAIFAALVGVVGNAWSVTMDEEKNPNYDPILEYKKDKQKC